VQTLQVLGVQVGLVAPLAAGERDVMSGIHKRPVTGPVAVSTLGLAGDEQADLTVHGGLAKAVYAYPVEHYAYWREQRFPDCELRVTQPRKPCYKFAAFFGDPLAPKKMVQTGYCGFYLAVDRPGLIAAGQAFERVAGPRQTPLMALFPKADRR